MGLFTRYAMDALMKTSHPEVIRRQCCKLHPLHGLQGHLPLRRCHLHPPQPR